MFWIYMKEVLAVSAFPVDFGKNVFILSKDFRVKKCDTGLRYVVFRFDGIVFFIHIIQTVCDLLSSTISYEKYVINES